MEWGQQFEIIKEKISSSTGKRVSIVAMAEFLGVSRGKVQAWARGQRPSADDLETIVRRLNVSPAWLLLGEGNPDDPWKPGQSKPVPESEPATEVTPAEIPGPVTEAVARVEQAMQGVDEYEVLKAAVALLDNRAQARAAQLGIYAGNVREGRPAAMHEPPVRYPDQPNESDQKRR